MIKEKKCFKCGKVKSLSDFYKHNGMKDGYLNKCKDCNKNDVSTNRLKKIDYYREYDCARGSRRSYGAVRNYRNQYPMKYAAHILAGNAVIDGRLIKSKTCESCGREHRSIHGHHDDYAKPLDVRWLCPPCHNSWHKENGEGANTS